METVKKTFKQARDFNALANTLLSVRPEYFHTKLGYAIKKVQESLISINKQYLKELDCIRIDHALTDSNKAVLLNSDKQAERPYMYDKAGLKKVKEEEENLLASWDEKEISVSVYYATEIPEKLEQDIIDSLRGFVIDPLYERDIVPNLTVVNDTTGV
jgi:hypothetical protein